MHKRSSRELQMIKDVHAHSCNYSLLTGSNYQALRDIGTEQSRLEQEVIELTNFS